jgi:oxalate decarboxylase
MTEAHRRSILSGLAVGAGGLLGAQLARADIEPSRRLGVGGTGPGPRNPAREAEDPDMVNPPATDHGTLPNLRFSFADSHIRQESGGWTRQVTQRELGISKTIAGVNMRLNKGGVRELHWHKEAEWLGPDGCEFLLVFDNGGFDEDSTFLISDWFKHTPPEVLGKNFGVPSNLFGHTPDPSQLYIFNAAVPGQLGPDKLMGAQPVPQSFSYRLMAQEPIRTKSGTVRIVDSHNFPASKTIAAALVEIEPGGLRELHWHPNNDEWQYYLEGRSRMGVFGSSGEARTFDYQAGDVGYVPYAMGHYIENTGAQPLRFLEVFKSSYYADFSLDQWMALTPVELLQAHLKLDKQVIGSLRKDKVPVVPT